MRLWGRKWKTNTNHSAQNGNKVVVGSDDGRLYVVSLEKGQELWSYEAGQPIGSSPAVAEGKVVVGCEDGTVYCFGGKD